MIKKVVRRIKRIIEDLASDKESKALNKISRLKRHEAGTFNFNGFNLKFPDGLTFVFSYKEIFRDEAYKFQPKTKEPFIIDCGANIGLSVIYFKQLCPSAKIIAFEPDSKIFSLLEENVASIGGKSDIVLFNKGVWCEEVTIAFKNEGTLGGRINSGKEPNNLNNESLIETVKLSNYINNKVDFLKLDIEGAEVEVMEEIENKLSYVDHIFIEYHSFESRPQQLQQILTILCRNNFRYYLSTPFLLRKHPFVDKRTTLSFDSFVNIYAIKQSLNQ
jgi:FkbM family methyltransferase